MQSETRDFRSCYFQACSQKIQKTYPYASHWLKEVTQNTVSGLYLQDKYLLHRFGSQVNTVLFRQGVLKEASYLQLFYVFFSIKINKYKTIISLLVLVLALQNICKEKKEQCFFFFFFFLWKFRVVNYDRRHLAYCVNHLLPFQSPVLLTQSKFPVLSPFIFSLYFSDNAKKVLFILREFQANIKSLQRTMCYRAYFFHLSSCLVAGRMHPKLWQS